jgi:Tfp pilus assembly protein PilF
LAANKRILMKSTRAAGWLSAAFAVATASFAAPFIPANDDSVLERLPAAFSSSASELRRMREQLSQAPGDLAQALALAKRYYELGRQQTDPRYYGYAEAALQAWWAMEAPPPEVQLLRAALLQTRHEFDAALQDLTRLAAADPRNAEAWLLRALVQMVQADYRGAMASCTPLLRLAGKGAQALSCVGSVALASGKPSTAYPLLLSAYAQAQAASAPERARLLTLLGKAAERMGKPELADGHFRAALALEGESAYTLTAWADFLLNQERYAEIPKWLEPHQRIDGLLLRLALAEQKLGAPNFKAHQESLRERFAASRQRGSNLHLGDEARFTLYLLQQPQQAASLASANFAKQREYGDMRMLLEAALAAGSPDMAQPALALIREFAFEDQALNDLAGKLGRRP